MHKFFAGFTGSPPMNFVDARIGEAGRLIELPGGIALPVPPNRQPVCARHAGKALAFGLRPEHLAVAAAGSETWTKLPCQVVLVEPLGAETLGTVRLGASEAGSEITGRFPPDAGLRSGAAIDLQLAMNRFHLFDPETGAAIRGADW